MSDDAQTHAEFISRLQADGALIYRAARTFGRSPAERDDLKQEIMVNLWRSYPRYDSRVKFSTWAYRIALNVAISWRRRERTQTQHLMGADEVMLGEVPAPQLAREQEDRNLQLLYLSIEKFDDFDKALVMLYLEGLNHTDIGAILGISSSNSATKIGRIKDRLRETFRLVGEI